MIKEIMPLPEEHFAAIVITFQDLDLSHCPWVLVLEDTEFPRRRHILLDLDCIKVKILIILDKELGLGRYLIANFIFRYVISINLRV